MWGGLLGLTLVAARLAQAPPWVYVDQGDSWIRRGLGACGLEGQSPLGFADVTSTTSFGVAEGSPDLEVSTARLWYRYPPVGYPMRLVNEGHSVGVTFPEQYKGGIGISDGATLADMLQQANHFRLYKMAIHHPSEHTLNGQTFPLEVHLIHQNSQTSQMGILAIWVKIGNPSPFLAEILLNGLPQQPFDEVDFNLNAQAPFAARGGSPVGLDIGSLIMRSPATDAPGVFAYNGSLTEPPCEQGVQWWVRRAPIEASLEQIQQLSNLILRLNNNNGNMRKLQQRQERKVELMSVVDQLTDGTVVIPAPATAPAASGVSTATTSVPCSSLQEFSALENNETAAVSRAKNDFNAARQNFEGIKSWVVASEVALRTSQGLYDGAPGPVEKMFLKWDVIEKQNGVATAKAAEPGASEALTNACTTALPYVCCHHNISAACQNAMSGAGPDAMAAMAALGPYCNGTVPATNGTNATSGAATVAVTTTPNPSGLEYGKYAVRLPTGGAGNPFSDSVAESTSRITPGRMQVAPRNLANNLKQTVSAQQPVPQAKQPELPVAAPASGNATNGTNGNATNGTNGTANATAIVFSQRDGYRGRHSALARHAPALRGRS